jgi:hypothetical protein
VSRQPERAKTIAHTERAKTIAHPQDRQRDRVLSPEVNVRVADPGQNPVAERDLGV